jgi:integration host factor subunit beta
MTYLTRSQLISRIAAKNPDLSPSDAAKAVKVLLDSISSHLAEGGRVEIRGFGSFSVYVRPPRIGHNPRTGVKVNVPEKHRPHFRPGMELKVRVNNGK